MTEAAPSPNRRPKAALIGVLVALALAGAGFAATYLGFFDPAAFLPRRASGEAAGAPTAVTGHGEDDSTIFLPLEPITVSLAPGQAARHLRFTATIETAPGALEAVAAVRPRILDVLNSYLRAVDVAELDAPAAMPRLRAQMLRRVQLVGGGANVRDVLITEFILN